MGDTGKFKAYIEPEVRELGSYMLKKGLNPEGAEGRLVSASLRWFMSELGIAGNSAFAASLRKAFVNQALFMLANHDEMREKFETMCSDRESKE